jgi:hypothetical protein
VGSFPNPVFAPLFISSLSYYSGFMDLMSASGSGTSGKAWPAANRAHYCPVLIPFPFNVRRLYAIQGSSAGNVDVGIYTIGGSRIVSSGSVAMAGTTIQYYASGLDVLLPPGAYYLALAASSASSTWSAVQPTIADLRLTGWLEQSNAFPLPATMTPVAKSDNAAVHFGMTSTESGF